MSRTVLLVDDAAVIRQVCSLALRREGFDVIEGNNGKDALARIDGRQVDLVITDINMPEMDGIELIKQLRSQQSYRFVPIVVLSSLSQEQRVQEGKQAGASGWIFKPFDSRKLLAAVRKFLQ